MSMILLQPVAMKLMPFLCAKRIQAGINERLARRHGLLMRLVCPHWITNELPVNPHSQVPLSSSSASRSMLIAKRWSKVRNGLDQDSEHAKTLRLFAGHTKRHVGVTFFPLSITNGLLRSRNGLVILSGGGRYGWS
jgi:hypothetical protein